MPHRLKQRQAKIQAKRKTTPWRKFVMEIGSRNPLSYYKHKDISLISRYPPSNRISKIEKYEEFVDDEINRYNQSYPEGKNFFDTMKNVLYATTLPSMLHYGSVETSNFSDSVLNSRNNYLSNCIILDCENCLYSYHVKEHCTNVFNSVMVRQNCENIFQSKGVLQSMNIFYSSYITNCSNIWFSNNLIGCSDCLFCSDIENKSYYIYNKPVLKEEFHKEKNKILSQKSVYYKWLKQKTSGNGNHIGSKNTTGSFVQKSNNVENGYYSFQINSGRNVILVGGTETDTNMYDNFGTGSIVCNDFYGVTAAGEISQHLYCSAHIVNSSHIFHSYFLKQCSYCLGCFGLTNKSYCIFNTQYTKDERYDKVDEIFTQMEQDGDLGKFFPGPMNPFYFNDTAAYLIDDSFTKEEVEAAGYVWRYEEIKVDIPEGVDVISTDDLDQYEGWRDQKRYIDPVILTKVIKDHQGNVYRIVRMEYDFLMKHALPLPRKHWLDRIKEHFKIEKD